MSAVVPLPSGGVSDARGRSSAGSTVASPDDDAGSSGAASPETVSALRSRIDGAFNHVRSPLYANGYVLMANTALASVLGFAYWSIASRLYDKTEFGRNYALVSTVLLLSAVTQLNMKSVLVRYLPRAGRFTSGLVVRAYAIAVAVALPVTALALFVAGLLAPEDSVLQMSLGLGAWFTISAAAWSIFNLQDSALTGLRKAGWVLAENTCFNILKIVLLFAFAGAQGRHGIFFSWTLPVLALVLPVNLLIFSRFGPAHAQATRENEQRLERRQLRSFVAGDYVGSLFAQASTLLLPILVVEVLSEDAAAEFATPVLIATAVDLVALNLATSLTVEAAHDQTRLIEYARSVLRNTLVLVVPVVAVLVVAAPLLLRVFPVELAGPSSIKLLRLLAIASLLRVPTAVYSSIARLQNRTQRNARLAGLQAFLLITLSVVLMRRIGVEGIGFAVLLTQLSVAFVTVPFLWRALRPTNLPRSQVEAS